MSHGRPFAVGAAQSAMMRRASLQGDGSATAGVLMDEQEFDGVPGVRSRLPQAPIATAAIGSRGRSLLVSDVLGDEDIRLLDYGIGEITQGQSGVLRIIGVGGSCRDLKPVVMYPNVETFDRLLYVRGLPYKIRALGLHDAAIGQQVEKIRGKAYLEVFAATGQFLRQGGCKRDNLEEVRATTGGPQAMRRNLNPRAGA